MSAQVATLLDRLDEAPERLIVVTGPRQTGKTTLVRQALGRIDRPHRYLPADEPEPVTPEIRLHYWRNNGREVDFVLVRGRRLVAVEVKSGPRRESLSGFAEFGERFDVAASLLAGEGGIPLSEFLSTPAREWFEDS